MPPVNQNPIAVDDSGSGSAGTSLDESHYIETSGAGAIGYSYFTVLSTDTGVTITTDGPTTDPYLYLLRDDGNLTTDDIITYDDDGHTPAGSYNNSIISLTLQPGNYIAAVGDYYLEPNEVISKIGSDDRSGDINLHFESDKDILLQDDSGITTEENTPLEIDVLANDSDPDPLDTLTINTFDAITTGGGSVALNGAGDKLVFDPDTDFDYLAVGESVTTTFTYDVKDNHDAVSNRATVTLEVTGSNDGPLLATTDTTGSVTEDTMTPTLTDTGIIAFTDVDLSDTHSVSVTATSAGALGALNPFITDDSTGDGNGEVTWTYTVDNSAIEYLAPGEIKTETFDVTVADAYGGTDTQTVTVRINALSVVNDTRQMMENETQIDGNVFTNELNPQEEMVVKPGSLTNATASPVGGAGKYGTLDLNFDGSYTYTLTEDMNNLGAGVDRHDEIFTFTAEWHHTIPAGGADIVYDGVTYTAGETIDYSQIEEIKIDIHGQNDQPLIGNVTVSAYEGLTGDTSVLATLGTGVANAADNETFEGQLVLQDLPGQPAGTKDLDTGDKHKFKIDTASINLTSGDLTAAQIAAIKASVGVTLSGAPETGLSFGKYSVQGNFDALSVGDTAVVTFDYYVEDTATSGSVSASDKKTVTLTVHGTNDAVAINLDEITRYNQLIDGDLYKSILANDGHAVGADVNDTVTVTDTVRTDLEFYNNGGQICVDNAGETLKYVPGNGDMITKGHFDFTYAATDGHTDPIAMTTVEVAMKNKDGDQVDFYQFGNACCDTLNGTDKNDMLSGGNGNDTLNGGAGADILYGGAGQDTLVGGAGNDIFIGGTGSDAFSDGRGNDMYVFAKGDGRGTIDDLNLEIYQDAMGHDVINHYFSYNMDEVRFRSVATEDIAIFMNGDDLEIKYSQNADDVVTVSYQDEAHYGIELIQTQINMGTGSGLDKSDIDSLLATISTYDIDASTAGVQTAQNIDDVQGNAYLMGEINAAFA